LHKDKVDELEQASLHAKWVVDMIDGILAHPYATELSEQMSTKLETIRSFVSFKLDPLAHLHPPRLAKEICDDQDKYRKAVSGRTGLKAPLKPFTQWRASEKWSTKIKRLEQLRRELEVRNLGNRRRLASRSNRLIQFLISTVSKYGAIEIQKELQTVSQTLQDLRLDIDDVRGYSDTLASNSLSDLANR
jgi:hypothetical protein